MYKFVILEIQMGGKKNYFFTICEITSNDNF